MFLLLYVMAEKENTSFLEVSQFLSKGTKKTNKKQTKTAKSGVKLVNLHTFPPVFGIPTGESVSWKKEQKTDIFTNS